MRITIERTVWGKIQTQLNKKDNASTAAMLGVAKVTEAPNHDRILWDPTAALCKALIVLLEREQGFMRKKEGAAFKLMTTVIGRLKKHYDQLLGEAMTRDALPTGSTE